MNVLTLSLVLWLVEYFIIVKLHTVVVYPRNYKEGDKLTTIMDRSPYGADGLELLNDIYVPFGFVTVGQDMRGTGQSEGIIP